MRYSEMKAFEKERSARRGAPVLPSRLIATPGGLPWWPVAMLLLGLALLLA